METERICPNCRKPLPPGVPLGLCPECLIKSGFPTGTEPGAASRLEGQTIAGYPRSDFSVEIKDQIVNGTLSGTINGGGPN